MFFTPKQRDKLKEARQWNDDYMIVVEMIQESEFTIPEPAGIQSELSQENESYL